MKNPSWAKVFAFFGFAIMGLALALYSTAVATAGVTAGIIRQFLNRFDEELREFDRFLSR